MSDLIAAPIDWGEPDPATPRYWMDDLEQGWVLTDEAGAILRPLTASEARQARRQRGIVSLAPTADLTTGPVLVPDIDGALAALGVNPFHDVATTAETGHTRGSLAAVSSPEGNAAPGGGGRVLTPVIRQWVEGSA